MELVYDPAGGEFFFIVKDRSGRIRTQGFISAEEAVEAEEEKKLFWY